MRHTIAIVIASTACSQQVYSPPSQAFSVSSLSALPQGRNALDLEVSRHAQIFDPAIQTGGLRLRTGVGDNTEVSAEGTAMIVADDQGGRSQAQRSIYAGRFGVRTNPKGGVSSLFAGLGGGFAPAGGRFAAVDAGFAIGYDNCVLVPILQGSGFLSEPFDARPIDVTVDKPQFDTPQRTIGVTVRAALRFSLGPSACRRGEQVMWLTAGFGSTSLTDGDTSASLFGLGFGLEIPL